MANTISNEAFRRKYFESTLAQVLRRALVTEKVCTVDNSDSKYIDNPYGSQPTATIAAMSGAYTPADFTITDDRLTVNNEVIASEHIRDFESTMSNFDLYASRMDELMYAIAFQIDRFVVNNLCEDGTGAYTTPVGGFTTSSNINKIMGDLGGLVMGFQDAYKGLFLIIENTDVTGFTQAQVANGFTFADSALENGFLNSYMGIDIYVVRSGTFVDATIGTTTVTNAGHRVFGVKGVATYASPRGIQYEEKSVSGKTGREIVAYGYVGFKLWAQKTSLIVDITLA